MENAKWERRRVKASELGGQSGTLRFDGCLISTMGMQMRWLRRLGKKNPLVEKRLDSELQFHLEQQDCRLHRVRECPPGEGPAARATPRIRGRRTL